MIVRTPALLYPSRPNLINSPVFSITSSWTAHQIPCKPAQANESLNYFSNHTKSAHSGSYASISDPSPRQRRPEDHTTKHKWPSSPNPTPYDIFAQSKDSKYNKAVFYNLVKIYHPDRNHLSPDSSIPNSVRLERYRLVVAANSILSDPDKRRAYDQYGAGWNGNRTFQDLYREADRSWRNGPGNASMNATWEDWEKWYRERDGEKAPQSPLYMSNELFVAMLCLFVVVGSMAQARRANSHSLNIVEMREENHAAISDDMRRRRDELSPLSGPEKIERFLRHRDSWNIPSTVDSSREKSSD
ncbi:hypothetical protein F5Y16DRAFT_303246 [Xylariaceae sp. FL0255]|nr:hypothetical protein F5Y16DRAFT_303246 [Xylariaceae sp. FL0255]